MMPIAIVLHGPTSAGKSSLARALQDSAETPTFHITLDAFVEMSRRRDMRSDKELNQALQIHYWNLQSTLRRVAESHFDIILDLVLRNDDEFDACLAVLASRPTFVIGVCAPLETLEERERLRPDRAEGVARSQFGHPAYSRPYAMRVDTSAISVQEGADLIRSFVRSQIP
ncbi:chloramphenicol phosphotransferase CPT family protein [Burkholderia vietnamiensis]|uniref:chloramphenicol phosphotransferase CPT family protein n=1 Tax=Burkholderia vietnamiensis TaxID=60552 RepID=UPI001CF5FD1C|nr:chloramphenicol phosphotransferase CPT family protein [Burkholderia vietnamiensis]HDR8937571.1 AAA family ATPase [Burkholderia vietnamiensis]HDR9263444.1 AAA family ATPase [Burkholderia vietnamiensis]